MKNKDDISTRKKQAFKSFLETNASPTIETKKNTSDNEAVYEQQYVEQNTICNVCGNQVPDAASKKKNCGFCQQVACLDHLRKRRRKKNKWDKICDSCQDKFLYDSYMKLQIKAEQSLAVEQQIVGMKYEDAKQVFENKRTKRRELSFFYEEINSKYDERMMALMKQDSRYQSLNNRLESDQITCSQIQEYINRMQNKIKSNFEQDFRILTKQDEKLGAQLTRIQKKCSQVRLAIQKRQKELQEAYERWQRQQYGKEQHTVSRQRAVQKQEGCFIF